MNALRRLSSLLRTSPLRTDLLLVLAHALPVHAAPVPFDCRCDAAAATTSAALPADGWQCAEKGVLRIVSLTRRRVLTLAAAAGTLADALRAPAAKPALLRALPRTGERIATVGLGTWLTFDVPISDVEAMARRRAVLELFFASGGRLVDSSPMYGHAEAVLGELLARPEPRLFSATKVWTPLAGYGPVQMRRSIGLWRFARADLMQVHKLLAWRAHLKTLRAWQEEGRTRYIGVTTSHGRGHDEVRTILRSE